MRRRRPSVGRAPHLVAGVGVAVTLGACAPAPLRLPVGPGLPFPEFREASTAARSTCRTVRTWTAEIAIGGRSGSARLRGRVLAGLARPERLRLEGLAPFGAPVFILVADEDGATLWVPRERRVLRHPSTGAILDALAGVALEPDELLDLVTGCVAAGDAVAGRVYPGGWSAVELDDGSTAFLRREGTAWRVAAGVRGAVTVEYRGYEGPWPRRLRVRTSAGVGGAASATDLTLRVAQVEVNVPLGPEAFTVEVPADAEPLTLEELRETGPLGVRPSGRGTAS